MAVRVAILEATWASMAKGGEREREANERLEDGRLEGNSGGCGWSGMEWGEGGGVSVC